MHSKLNARSFRWTIRVRNAYSSFAELDQVMHTKRHKDQQTEESVPEKDGAEIR